MDDERKPLLYGDLDPDNRREATPEDREADWSDYYLIGKSTIQGAVKSFGAGALEYAGDKFGNQDLAESGAAIRRDWGKAQEDTLSGLTPAMQKSVNAKLFPGEGETSYYEAGLGRTLAGKTFGGAVSLVPYVIGSTLAAYGATALGATTAVSALVGAGTARVMAGVQQTGDVASKIYEFIDKQTDEQLQGDSEAYKDYRELYDEKEARRRYMADVTGLMPAFAGVLSAAMGGAEAKVGARLGGAKSVGWREGAIGTGKAEGKQEAGEGFTSEAGSQYQLLTSGLMKQADWRKIVNETLESGLIGSIVGGATGAASNIGGRSETVAPPPPAAPAPGETALPPAGETALPTDPAAGTLTATSDPEAIERLMKAEQAPEPKPKKGRKAKAPTIQVSEGPDADQLAALNATNTTQQTAPEAASEVAPQPSVMAPPIPPPVADALGNLTTPRAPAPAPEPPAPAPAPIPPPVAAAVQKQTAVPTQSEVQPISDNSGGWNYIKFGNAQVELQKDGIGWKPTDGQSTIFYATGKGPGTRRRGEAHLSGMAKAGVPAEVMPIFTDYANGKIGKDQVLEQLRGLEAKVKQRQAAAPKAPVDTGTNLQQLDADLLAEQKELVDINNPRAVQMFPTNTTPLDLPEGMDKVETFRGIFHFNPKKKIKNKNGKLVPVNKGVIQRLSAATRENELLGLGDRNKQDVADNASKEGGVTTASELTPEGARVKSVATTVADAERQAQMLREKAAPENTVVIEPTEQALAPRLTAEAPPKWKPAGRATPSKPQPPSAPRTATLRDVSEAGQAADAAQAEADAAAAARVAEKQKVIQAKAASEARAETVEGKVGVEAMLTKDQQRAAKVSEDEKAAAEVVADHMPTEAEANLNSKNGAERQAAMQAMYNRLQNMVKAAGQRGIKIPERVRKQADDLVLLASAKKFLDARAPAAAKGGLGTVKPYQEFVAAETSLRGGREAAAAERARAKAEMDAAAAKFSPKEEGKTTDEGSGMLSQAAEEMAMTPEDRIIAAEQEDTPRTLAEARAEVQANDEFRKRIEAEADTDAQADAESRKSPKFEAFTSRADKFKEYKRPKFEAGRPKVTGKVPLSRTPKVAAAVAVAQKAEPAAQPTLTKEAEDLLANVASGGVPGFMTNNLRRVARENGIVVTPEDTPNSVIEKLQAKGEAPTPAQPKVEQAKAVAKTRKSKKEREEAEQARVSAEMKKGRDALSNAIPVAQRRPKPNMLGEDAFPPESKAKSVYETGKAFVADVYHGTNEIFDRFSNAFKNSRFVSGFNSFWFAENPEVASSYTRKGLTQTQRDAGVSDIEGGNVRLSRIKMDNPFVIDMGGRRYDPIEYNRVFKQAADGGHDGIVFQNVIDGANVIGTIHAVFDENQISDKFLPGRPEGQLFPSMPTGQRARARVSAPPAGPTVSMAGVDFTPIQSTNVSRSMKMVSDDFYKMFRGGPDRLFATFFRNKLTQRVGDVPVHIVTPEDIQNIYFKATGKVGVPDGIYRNGVIALNVNTVADPVSGLEVAMHEALHAWSENAINSSPGLQRALDVMVARGLSEHRLIQDLEGQGTDRSSPYGLTDRYEFISEAFSSPDFRSFLSSVELSKADRMLIEREIGPVKGPFKTALDAFLQLLRSAMSLPDTLGNYTLLDAVMRAGAKIDAIVEQQGAGLDISAPARASITAQGVIDSSIDRKNAFTSWSKRNWAKFITGGQMRQQYADTVIGPALAKIWEGVSATGPRIQQIKAEGDALATTAIDLSKKNPTEFRSLVQIMEEARMMNVNIEGANAHLGKDATKGWQAKGRLGDLQSRFAQIRDGELKQLYRDMAAYYRDSHNAIVKSSVTSILEGLELRQARGKAKGNALTEQQITDLTKRVMDQEMTAADKALLGVTVFNALKNAAAFHRIQGDYFPLMRYGDHVVTTTDKIRDTMGGKLEEPDTVLFRDKSNTAARRAAENFVKKSDLVHLSTEKVFIDNATGKEVSEDDAKSLNDVDIGYRVTMQTKGVYFFETGKAAEEFARTNPEGHDTVSNPEIRMGSGYQAQIMTGTQVASLNSAIDGRVKTGDITDGQAALLKSIVNQAATRMLGGNRIASRRLKSQKVTGASSDVARNLLQYNAAAANHIAVAENAPAIRDGLTEMTEALKGYAGNDRAQLVAVAEEVKARVDQGIVDPNAPGKVMKDIMALSFLARLFSPAYNVINGMQPWMVTLPILGGRFGNVAASAAMGRAYSDIGFGDAALQGVMNTARATRQAFKAALIGTDDIVGNIRKKVAKADDGADLTRMMDELIRLNAIDITAGFEVAASAAEGRGTYGKTLAGVDRIARQLPQVVEAVNRSVSAIAAYRLARQNGQTHEQATQFALNTVQNTQGDYSAANAPRFFNNPILRPALQFKKYAQMMTYLLGDMAYRAFNGATPEEKRIALKQIGNILSVQMLMAGALGLPGLEIIKAGFLIASMLGIGGGWDEVEEKLRKLLDDSTNKTFGELVSSGILSRAIGIDVSQRMSLADMWLFGEPKGDTSESIQAYLFKQVVGAPGSLLLDARDGFALAVEGEWGKAAGKLIPIKFAADFAKAAHNYSESKYEEPEKRKVSGVGEAAVNVFGFRTGRQAELGRAVGASIKEKQDTQKEFKKLQKAFYGARTKGDQIKAIARNREWNDSLSKAQWRLRLPVTPRELRTAQ